MAVLALATMLWTDAAEEALDRVRRWCVLVEGAFALCEPADGSTPVREDEGASEEQKMCWLSIAASRGGLSTECCAKVAPSYDIVGEAHTRVLMIAVASSCEHLDLASDGGGRP